MPNTKEKEKLITALGKPLHYGYGTLSLIAEELMAEGVTVQEWISVKDKLPKVGEDVLVTVFDGYDTWVDMDCLMRDGKWCFETGNRHISHWRPMPQPPKGE